MDIVLQHDAGESGHVDWLLVAKIFLTDIFDGELAAFFQKILPKEFRLDFLHGGVDGVLDFRQFGQVCAVRYSMRCQNLARRDFLCLGNALNLQAFDARLDNDSQSHFVVTGEVVYDCIDEKIHLGGRGRCDGRWRHGMPPVICKQL